ncbi:hypothetical protein DR864_09195 [Runella rosea]|uniref:HTH cro/C1-type domain-containing protein n=1 Tax=Runella rosea TaxID=2259595 RepID=A0A344TGX2_9BACT|nr:helix-turn-helix transcriptional regulator [Runella rosea]AXE17893.1 hypothetical protein DR864_09195 [Runella rosea]
MTTIEHPKTPLQRVVSKYEEHICGKWKPSTQFYQRTGINQKRFGMILRGELDMTLKEAQLLAKFFKVSTDEFND